MAASAFRVAYSTGQYPRYSDVWLQREISAMRELGLDVQTFAVRAAPRASLVSDHQRNEQDGTTYLLPVRLPVMLRSLMRASLRPRRLWRAVQLAHETSSPGRAAAFRHVAYLLEAVILAGHLRSARIDHLHNHLTDSCCTVAMLAAELSGCSFSFTMHGPGIFFEAQKWRIDVKVARAAFVVCISSFCASQAACFCDPTTWSKLQIVHCGVDIDHRRSSSADRHGNKLLFVGRLESLKGLDILLRSMLSIADLHPGVQLTIVGDGPERVRLQNAAEAAGLGGSVHFTGPLNSDAINRLLVSADIFVLPSFAEGVPVVLMEAMAMSVPVVSTHVGGMTELIHDGESGILIPAFDASSLTEAISRLLGDPDLRARMGESGRQTVVDKYDLRKEASRLKDLFVSVHVDRDLAQVGRT
jgi:glycosyltransferase involved in cell wall biosynthesis